MVIYADNAATTKTSDAAIRAMLRVMEETWANPSSLHSAGQRAKEVLEGAREEAASLLGCEPREITFTSGGSEADNMALVSAAKNGARKNKKHIVSTAFEHHAVLHTLKKLEREGWEVTLVPVPENGVVTVGSVRDALRDDTCLVSVMFANNEIGTVQPVAEIGALCRERGIPFHTDAVQAIGHVYVNVKEQNIDMLSLSAHKFHGPRGIGLLYARRGIVLSNLIEGGAQERGKRAGTEDVASVVGMVTAMREAMESMDRHAAALIPRRDRLIEGLLKIPHAALNGDAEKRLPGNVNMSFEGVEGESLLLLLDDRGIEASSGSACTSGSLDPSHVLLAIGRPHEAAHGSLRLTLGEDVTDEEIDYIIRNTGEVVERLRAMSPLWIAKTEGRKEFVL